MSLVKQNHSSNSSKRLLLMPITEQRLRKQDRLGKGGNFSLRVIELNEGFADS